MQRPECASEYVYSNVVKKFHFKAAFISNVIKIFMDVFEGEVGC